MTPLPDVGSCTDRRTPARGTRWRASRHLRRFRRGRRRSARPTGSLRSVRGATDGGRSSTRRRSTSTGAIVRRSSRCRNSSRSGIVRHLHGLTSEPMRQCGTRPGELALHGSLVDPQGASPSPRCSGRAGSEGRRPLAAGEAAWRPRARCRRRRRGTAPGSSTGGAPRRCRARRSAIFRRRPLRLTFSATVATHALSDSIASPFDGRLPRAHQRLLYRVLGGGPAPGDQGDGRHQARVLRRQELPEVRVLDQPYLLCFKPRTPAGDPVVVDERNRRTFLDPASSDSGPTHPP